jgi:PAS domain S-box-containing protein
VSSLGHYASTSLAATDAPAPGQPFGGVFDLAVVGMALVTRVTHRVHRLNPALQSLLGRTEPGLLGYPLVTLVHDDDRATVGALLRLSEARPRPSSSEARLLRSDGSHLRVTLTVTPAPASDHRSEFLLCQVSDVDEQRRVEHDLRLADRLLATALEATTDAVYMKDADGRYLMLNRAAAAYFGQPASEVVGHVDTEFFVPEEAAALMAVDRCVLASGVATTFEEIISTDEGPRILQSTKGVYRDDAGRPAGIFGISRDITEQRQAIDEHRRFEEALELTVEGVAHLDLEGRFIWVNDAFARLCGYPPLEMIGLPWSALAHPDDLDHMSAAHAGVAKGDRIEREVRTVRRDGSWFYAQLIVVMAKDGDGAHSGFYSTLRDVSDRKVAEDVARRASTELARRNGELESFAAMVAHDLRQPLQVVGGFAELLARRSDGSADELATRYLAAIERGVGKMTAMVDSMLEYARTGEAEAPVSLVDSHRIVADVIDGLEGSMNGGQVVVTGQLPVLPADPAQLSRVFENLIGNALKFRGDTAPVVQVAAERRGDAWRFTVQDDCMGVSTEFAGQLFGMFAREHRSGPPGTGMGLAICRKIVEHHGGRIWFESAPEGGSIFAFTLPVEPSASA